MKTRFCSPGQSPEAGKSTLMNSKFSTERSPITALLFEAKRTVALPLITPEDLGSSAALSKAGCVGCSA